MSAVGQWYIELQGLPEYQIGWEERRKGTPIQDIAFLHDINHGDPYEALKAGWRDCDHDLMPKCEP
jgi:hypothetical protein